MSTKYTIAIVQKAMHEYYAVIFARPARKSKKILHKIQKIFQISVTYKENYGLKGKGDKYI